MTRPWPGDESRSLPPRDLVTCGRTAAFGPVAGTGILTLRSANDHSLGGRRRERRLTCAEMEKSHRSGALPGPVSAGCRPLVWRRGEPILMSWYGPLRYGIWVMASTLWAAAGVLPVITSSRFDLAGTGHGRMLLPSGPVATMMLAAFTRAPAFPGRLALRETEEKLVRWDVRPLRIYAVGSVLGSVTTLCRSNRTRAARRTSRRLNAPSRGGPRWV
jgi:hypothetical protein